MIKGKYTFVFIVLSLLFFIKTVFAENVTFIKYSDVGLCISVSKNGGIKVESKSYPIKIMNPQLYSEDLLTSSTAKMLQQAGVPDDKIKDFLGAGTVAEVFPGGKISATKDRSLIDENGKVVDFSLLFNDTNVVLGGYFLFGDNFVDWPITSIEKEQNKRSLKLSGCVYATELDILFCSIGAKLQSSKRFKLCGSDFLGQIELIETGVKLAPNAKWFKSNNAN